MTEQPRPPLWRDMDDAYANTGYPAGAIRAAEITATAEALERWQLECYGVVLPDVREVVSWLREEAVRAEAGE